ncbi:MAG: PTS sugar transporter subunit IIB [Longicatena sp.]
MKKINSILCCCGSGLGSSMLVRMNVDKVIKKLGIEDVSVSHSSLSDATEGAADLFIVGKDLEEFVSNLKNKIVLNNIMDMKELEEKLDAKFKEE